MTPLCFIDAETDGVHPGRRAWEIAIIRRDDSGQTEWVAQVDNVDLSAADPFGLKVGGFYDRHIDYGGDGIKLATEGVVIESEEFVARDVERLTRGSHLVGAVPDFDARTLDPMLRRHGLIPAWHYHLIDVEAMAVGWLRGQGYGTCTCGAEAAGKAGHPVEADCKVFYKVDLLPWKSDEISRACGVEPPTDDERHTALGDARWAMRWYDAMTGGAA